MQQFKPTTDQIRLAEALFTCIAHETFVRPIVVQYKTEILKRHQFHISPEWVSKGATDHIILDHNESYLLSQADFEAYHAECNVAREAAQLHVDHPDKCPLLVAEALRIDTENALLAAMAMTPGLDKLNSSALTLEMRTQVLNLILKMLAPFCGNAKSILDRYQSTT